MRNRVWGRAAGQRRFQAVALLAVLFLGANLASAQSAPVRNLSLERLQKEVARLATIAGGKVGVGAIHLESGRAVYLNANEPFPMASTFKVPIAVEVLRRVEAGQVSLDDMVSLRLSDLHPGSGILTDYLDDPGLSVSMRNLLEIMLIISDNSAADLLLKAAGGGENVTARLRALGVEGIRVDRSTLRLIFDSAGIAQIPPEPELNPKVVEELLKHTEEMSKEEEQKVDEAFDADPRDTATPAGMARLLEKIWRGEALGPQSTALLLDIMKRCETGQNRLKGFLPPGTEVAHKTGTIGGTSNDVGIITLPDEAGHVVAAVFVKESKEEIPVRERAIAQIARALYDYFLFNAGAKATATLSVVSEGGAPPVRKAP